MTLLFAVLLAALAVILAPVTVKVMDRQAGYPLAVLFLIAAVLIAKDFSAIAAGRNSVSKPPGYAILLHRGLM